MSTEYDQEINAYEINGYEEKDRKEKAGCDALGFQDVNVCVPITIKPFGEVGNAKTKCLGKAEIASGCKKCAGKPGEMCQFTISQKLRVEVPVVFGARAEVGETFVDCKRPHDYEDCEPCGE